MNADEIRRRFLECAKEHGHTVIPRAKLVPEDDQTTLFTGSGMQPLLKYLLGEPHPLGTRLADSQTCVRAQDIDEVGDNRHTTFFEMLGNWLREPRNLSETRSPGFLTSWLTKSVWIRIDYM